MLEKKTVVLNTETGAIETREYENGILNGVWEVTNGIHHRIKANYKEGKLDGEYQTWLENGEKNVHCFYVKGVLHGLYKSWWANGNIKEKGIYEHGLKVGEYYWFDQEGKIIQRYVFSVRDV